MRNKKKTINLSDRAYCISLIAIFGIFCGIGINTFNDVPKVVTFEPPTKTHQVSERQFSHLRSVNASLCGENSRLYKIIAELDPKNPILIKDD